MGATSNVTTVHYGTTWDETTLLEEVKQTNLKLERKDGLKRHFRYDWQEVARFSPDYQAYVASERARLGENHPLFLTQYRLLPVRGSGRFLSPQQRAQLQGEHPRRHSPVASRIYVAGIDLAGEAEEAEDRHLRAIKPRQDATVVTIAELAQGAGTASRNSPRYASWSTTGGPVRSTPMSMPGCLTSSGMSGAAAGLPSTPPVSGSR